MQYAIVNTRVPVQFRILFCIVLFEYAVFVYSGVSFSFLYKDSFFQVGADPAFWLVYILKIPQEIAAHFWIGVVLDVSIVLCLLVFIGNPYNSKLGLLLFFLLFLFYIFLMGYLTHRNYQFGFFLVFIPFIFKNEMNKFFAYEALRYFLLLFYCSAAFLKLFNGTLFAPEHFGHMLDTQFSAYFLENNTGLRTSLNLYLISHVKTGHVLYLASFAIESATITGFFTKRFDKWLAVFLLAFHFMTWLIMDIAPFGQLAFIYILYLGNSFPAGKADTVLVKSL